MSKLVRFNIGDVTPKLNPPFFPEVLEGNPTTRAWSFSSTEDGRGAAGIWECTPCVWRIDYTGIWEFCHIIEGQCVITPDGGTAVELSPGDAFVCEPGLKGTWRVVSKLLKHFTVIQ
ncbi:cupin domain-containing protein [Mesorhizobium sp. B2-4-17]|uniref:cupin domain-containing protein n=1 Tax=Mesorhizobium sp. B2-4-17 TaxID=2589932 RepID=UPI00112BB089|nr:cupin domain-containing protein [Mesorhizobium sp. B2-4-17]TPK91496.1 cupin domain-containing protein [Mesorhizobium sp. B2-4-17]